MFGPLAQGVYSVLALILNMLQILVVASMVVSWIGDQSNQIVQMIRSMTEPVYRPIRKLTKNIPGPFDWAPLIVMLLIVFVQRGVLPYIIMLGDAPPAR